MSKDEKMLGFFPAAFYERMETLPQMRAYEERHGIQSLGVLTVHDDDFAGAVAYHLAPRIEGRIVVEIGGGIGLLALHMGAYAKRVFCIEANPCWGLAFTSLLLEKKPKNVSFLFGAADEFAGQIRGDVALFCTHSGVSAMREVAGRFAREVIDVYGEVIERAPDRFDALARTLRPHA